MNNLKPEIVTKFLTNTDETGRFIHCGKVFAIDILKMKINKFSQLVSEALKQMQEAVTNPSSYKVTRCNGMFTIQHVRSNHVIHK